MIETVMRNIEFLFESTIHLNHCYWPFRFVIITNREDLVYDLNPMEVALL